ncbi:ATP-binding cassette domain-containing protein [Pedobacter sp. UBA5917]|jgi:ABC-2 type transport system ATP-binding protein|uniref:ABC transporter ATP-binding protein n=1 Tax=Pedobacter sp. UBA5917 TaxID=1947061 RepID=UPI0025E4133A|nr:ABC transporter ATP-binding protein [Pedobacter sp. UBA5917]
MIEIIDLSFGYSKKNILLKKLNLSLEKGHIYGLLGKNGAGKSTLLKNISGLAFPFEGKCTVNGKIACKREPSFLQELFFIPEEVHMPSLSTNTFVDRTSHFYPKFDKPYFYKVLSEFDVDPGENLNRLSFGQQKKMMISFGLATNTSLLIMDEPTNGLDIPSKVQFRKVISSALTDERCIIISTHQVRDLDSLIDSLVILHNKKIVLNLPLEAIEEKLFFSAASKADPSNVLYCENNMIGTNTISIKNNEQYGKVDMELLFNAIISGDNQILQHLN